MSHVRVMKNAELSIWRIMLGQKRMSSMMYLHETRASELYAGSGPPNPAPVCRFA